MYKRQAYAAGNTVGFGAYGKSEANKMGDIAINKAFNVEGGFDMKTTILTAVNKVVPEGEKVELSGSEDHQAYQLAKAISDMEFEETRNFANEIAGMLEKAGITPTATQKASGAKVTFPGLADGYYIICSDSDDEVYKTESHAMTSAIATAVHGDKAIEIEAKVKQPTLEKTVKDNTPGKDAEGNAITEDFSHATTAGILTGKTEGAKTDIDNVTYKLAGTVAKNIIDFKSYKYQFTDAMPKGVDVTLDELGYTPGEGENPSTWADGS